MRMKSELFKKYTDVCNEYLRLFCEKHEFDYEPNDWIGNEVGGIICVADLYVSLKDMITDIEYNTEEDEFIKWYDYCLDCHYAGLNDMNYHQWLLGCPRHPGDVLREKAKEGIKKITEEPGKSEAEDIVKKNPSLKKLRDDINKLIDEYE